MAKPAGHRTKDKGQRTKCRGRKVNREEPSAQRSLVSHLILPFALCPLPSALCFCICNLPSSPGWVEPIPMICPPLTPSRLVLNWLERHRNPVSFGLHIIGIPPTLIGVMLIPVYVYCLSVPIFLFALAN